MMKKKQFIKQPEYPGGKEAFQRFVKENLRYPEEAISNSIEGIVQVWAEIKDTGEVNDASVEKSLGYGCDEEALRLVKMMKFGAVRNRGVRVTVNKTIKIEFKIKRQKLDLSYNYKPKQLTKTEQKPPVSKPVTYGYTIKF